MKPVGVVVALRSEARTLEPAITAASRHCRALSISVGGPGAEAASVAGNRLLRHGVCGLVSWGVAGALHADLHPGDVLLPQVVVGTDGERYVVDEHWQAALHSRLGSPARVITEPLAEAAEVLRDSHRKYGVHASTGAYATDMESAAVARLAIRHGLPFVVVRVVLDDLAMTVPRAAIEGTNGDGETNLEGVLKALVCAPADIVAMIRVARAFNTALRTLAGLRSVLLEVSPPVPGSSGVR